MDEIHSGTDRVYTVSELTRLVKGVLETALPQVWVEGEISNFHRHSSGHIYYTLKDEKSQIRAVLFRGDARRAVFEMKDGLQVVCRGRINVYEPRGEYQIVVDLVEPKGKGALQLAFEQLRDKLKSEGLFDPARKKKIPVFPKKIGIVTSPRGAAIADILRILDRRFARVHILLYPVKVQGEGAADEIAAAIEYFGRRGDMDVLIVGRGGGSIEDLWAFNEEKVARAIAACPVPVISAVGHEVDFTIADFAADLRASTPSAAAEIVVETETVFQERIAALRRSLEQEFRYGIRARRENVTALTHHRIFQGFRVRLLNLQQQVDEMEERARTVIRGELRKINAGRTRTLVLAEKAVAAMREKIRRPRATWERLTASLHNLSPFAVLKKGYAICWKAGGLQAIRKAEEAVAGEDIIVSFHKGELTCRVRDIDPKKRLESRFVEEKP
ncbi:MAG: exodeoxyribonuclease VII large subunit [Acidobacteriota bacterium]|nr:exodeoxyribonuclease VII large subunit [Acidobacteriota bacterium]